MALSGHALLHRKCLLMTQSGHSHFGPDPSPVTALPGFAGAFRTAAQAGGKSLSFRPLANGETTLGIMRRKSPIGEPIVERLITTIALWNWWLCATIWCLIVSTGSQVSGEVKPSAFLLSHALWLGSLTVAVVYGTHLAIQRANSLAPAILADKTLTWMLVIYLCGLVWWFTRFMRHFQIPTNNRD